MASQLDQEKVAELAKEVRERVHLSYLPIGLSFVKSEDEIPARARRPSERGQAWPMCLAATRNEKKCYTIFRCEKCSFKIKRESDMN